MVQWSKGLGIQVSKIPRDQGFKSPLVQESNVSKCPKFFHAFPKLIEFMKHT